MAATEAAMNGVRYEADTFIAGLEPGVVRYLGPDFSYSDIMAKTLFGTEDIDAAPKRGARRTPQYIDHANFSAVTEGVYHNRSDRLVTVGILPVENTKTSTVQEVTDALLTGDFNILGEGSLLIRLVLAGQGDSVDQVTTIYSQSKPFGQATELLWSRPFVQTHMDSTSAAAQYVAEYEQKDESEPAPETMAALCSMPAAVHNGLHIIKKDVQDDKNNQTRFLIIQSRKGPIQPDLEMLKPGGKLGANNLAVVSGIVSPTKKASDDGYLRAMNKLRDMGIWGEQEGRRNSQREPAGGDRDYLVRFMSQPKNLWDVFRDEKNYREQMRFRLLGVYAVGSTYAERA